MKRFIALLIALSMSALLCLSFASCSKLEANNDLETIKKAGVLKVGMECNYAPFNWTQATASDTSVALSGGGYADGYDVSMAKKIASALGVKLEIVKLEWEGLTSALESGKIDCIIAGMSPTAERKLSIDFSDNYYKSELVIVVKKDSAYVNASKLSDFSGAKITGQHNTFHYSVIDQINGVSKQTAMGDFPTMIVALQGNKIDGYVSELPGAVSAAASNSDITYVEFDEGYGFTASDDDVAIAVGIRKGSNLASEINTVLSKISDAERLEIMNWAVANQPASEE